ncbi:hypothetical protein [Streptomyces sp. NPDC056987]|uniref:hypothetical protein n=1 Tax=Streptomyces sp. NPDC056987 TaxID=3345988 RepID=UPI0036286B52
MHIRRLYSVLSVMALGTVTALAVPATAQAAETPVGPAAGASASVIAADGNFYAWRDINGGGGNCAWSGNDSDWSTCSPGGNMRNQASDIWNNGYAGSYDDVLVYWGLNYTGAYACIPNGRSYNPLTSYYFPNTGTGGGQNMNDNISSHKWANAAC